MEGVEVEVEVDREREDQVEECVKWDGLKRIDGIRLLNGLSVYGEGRSGRGGRGSVGG